MPGPGPAQRLPTRQRTLEVIGLVETQPDLVSEAAAALAHVGDSEAEAGQARGAVLQVEVPIGAGPCWAAWEWAVAGSPPQAAPTPAHTQHPPARPWYLAVERAPGHRQECRTPFLGRSWPHRCRHLGLPPSRLGWSACHGLLRWSLSPWRAWRQRKGQAWGTSPASPTAPVPAWAQSRTWDERGCGPS